MKRKVSSAGSVLKRFAYWRNERGFSVVELVLAAAALAVVVAAYEPIVKKIRSLQGGFTPLKNCNVLVTAAVAGVADKFAVQVIDPNTGADIPKKDENGNIVYPPGLQIPENEPAVVVLRQCLAIQETFSNSVKNGNIDAINELNNKINSVINLVGKCQITGKLRDGVAGVQYSEGGVEVHIPFSASSPATGTITVTGAAAGSGSFTSTNSPNWIMKVDIAAEASKDAGGKTSTVTVDAKTAATVGRNKEGKCFGASEEVNGQCVQLVQMDGTCPPGQEKDGGRCFIHCPDPVTKDINWKPPGVKASLKANGQTGEITINANEKVTLHYEIKDATSASLAGGPPIILDKGAATGDFPVFPTKNTTYTLLALSPSGIVTDSRSAVVKVRVRASSGLTLDPIVSPVTDIHQTVTGTAPKPEEGQRAHGVETASAGENGTVEIRMNGALQATVPIGDDGHFAANVVLSKVVTIADLSVSDFSNAVASCGPASRGVVVTNSATDVENTITATFTPPPALPAAAPATTDAPADAASASITVRHAVKLTNFNVNWGNCPGGSPDQPINTILEAGQSLSVGTVDCGVFSRTDPVFSIGSCFPIVTIGTSLSSLQETKTWTFATPSPDDPICPEEEGDGDG
jgi:hypothetical protein